MRGRLHIIGLGPSGLDQLSLGSYRLLRSIPKVFMRTENHPCVEDLKREEIQFESFDYLYDKAESFENVYEGIVAELDTATQKYSDVVYAVPGHPNVAERSVALILDKLTHCEVHIYPAISFLDSLFRAVSLDPIQGLAVRNYDKLKEGGVSGKDWLIIPQVYDRLIASELKLDLMEIYPDDAEAIIISSAGLSEESIRKIPLYELDHYEVNHLTTVVIPPCSEVKTTETLLEVMTKLRSPEGCPWDKEQTHESLKPYLLEESYEVIDAINNQDMYNLCEELGDLLLQVVFHAQVASEQGEFSFKDVVRGIVDKLIRRHPHVFGTVEVENSEEVLQNWEQIKREEKGESQEKPKVFKDSLTLPALILAAKTQVKAARLGFDWEDFQGPFAKVYEELDELKEAIEKGTGIKGELGDVLFSIVNISRFLEVDAEEALRMTVLKFQRRFNKMMELISGEGLIANTLGLNEMDKYWEKAKKYDA